MAVPSDALCDYGSSVEGSADEAHGQMKQGITNEQMSARMSITMSPSNSTSEEKKEESPHKNLRQYRERRRSRTDVSPTPSSPEHRRSKRLDCKRRSGKRDRRDRSHSHLSEKDHERHRHGSNRHRRRKSPRRRHRKHGSRARSRSSSRSPHRHRDHRRRRHSRSPREGVTIHQVYDSRTKSKIRETTKPIDPLAAKQEVAAKASVMIASAMNRNIIAGGNGLPQMNKQTGFVQMHEDQLAKAKAHAEAAAVAANLPKYYNPLSVNAAKLAEQQQKRKLLWSKKSVDPKEEEKSSMWKTTSIVAGKGDTAAAAKFCKLMGIHGDVTNAVNNATPTDATADALNKAQAQADLFQRLERDYEMSRTLTHTQRGVGFGYPSSAGTDYNAYTAMRTGTASDHPTPGGGH